MISIGDGIILGAFRFSSIFRKKLSKSVLLCQMDRSYDNLVDVQKPNFMQSNEMFGSGFEDR